MSGYRVRWSLARWLAGVPIVPDPNEGLDGMGVVYRKEGVLASFRLDRGTVNVENVLPRYDDAAFDVGEFGKPRTRITFSGSSGPEPEPEPTSWTFPSLKNR